MVTAVIAAVVWNLHCCSRSTRVATAYSMQGKNVMTATVGTSTAVLQTASMSVVSAETASCRPHNRSSVNPLSTILRCLTDADRTAASHSDTAATGLLISGKSVMPVCRMPILPMRSAAWIVPFHVVVTAFWIVWNSATMAICSRGMDAASTVGVRARLHRSFSLLPPPLPHRALPLGWWHRLLPALLSLQR